MLALFLSKLAPYKIYFYIAIVLASIYSGWYARGLIEDRKELKVKNAIISEMVKQDSTNRNIIKDYQTNQLTLRESYITLGQELDNVKGKLGKCKADGSVVISTPAVRLWNNIGEGHVSETPSRTSKGASESSTTKEEEYSLDEIYENYAKNSEICNDLREQIRRIIQWDKETFK